jgi:hypothetical protein
VAVGPAAAIGTGPRIRDDRLRILTMGFMPTAGSATSPAPMDIDTGVDSAAVDSADFPAGTAGGGPTMLFGGGLLGRVSRATGYARLGSLVPAAGPFTFGAGPVTAARLVLPIDRVVAADVSVRVGGSRLVVTVTSTNTALAAQVQQLTCDVAGLIGLRAAEVKIAVRLPGFGLRGTDVIEAALTAAARGLIHAAELDDPVGGYAALLGSVHPGVQAGLAVGQVGIIDTASGAALAVPAAQPRLHVVLLWPETPDHAGDLPADFSRGQLLPAPGLDGSTGGVLPARAFAAWLLACAGDCTDPVGDLLADRAAALPGFLGVLGGHTATTPIAALFEVSETSTTATREIAHGLRSRLPAGWVTDSVLTAPAPRD